MNVIEFISSIDNNLYNKLRGSLSDAECRRLLKEHLRNQKELLIEKKSDYCKIGRHRKNCSIYLYTSGGCDNCANFLNK